MLRLLLSGGFMFFLITSYGQDISTGLIACYPFTGNAKDATGQGHDGTAIGPVLTSDRFGNASSAYAFNGTDKITLPASFVANEPKLTISTWANISAMPADGEAQFIFTIGDATAFNAQTLTNDYASPQYYGWGIGGSNKNLTPQGKLGPGILPDINKWYNLTWVVSLDSSVLYINGQTFSTQPGYSSRLSNNGVPLYYYQLANAVMYIGLRSNGTQGFKGAIDDIAIYKRNLSPSEVFALYQKGGPCVSSVQAPTVPNLSVCKSMAVTLNALSGSNLKWYDQPVGGNLLFTGNPFATPVLSVTTSYYVSSTVGSIESSRTKVTVTIRPGPQISCSIPSSGFTSDDITTSVVETAGTAPYAYTFNFGDGQSVSASQPSVIHHYDTPSQFSVTVSVTDSLGCTASCNGSITIALKQTPNIVSLIACYPFSGNANDATGNGHNGAVSGPTLTTDRFGNPNSAYTFHGSDAISLPAAFIASEPRLTISTWFNIASLPADGEAQFIFTIGDGTAFNAMTLTNDYATPQYYGMGVGGSDKNLAPQGKLGPGILPNTNVWYNLTWVVSLDSSVVYINGKTFATQPGYSNRLYSSVPLYYYQLANAVVYIGLRSNGSQGFKGTIDDIAVYKGNLSASEVFTLYQSGGACVSSITKPTVSNATICGVGSVSLTAGNGISFNWYDQSVGGNLLFSGNPFITPALSATTSYYVASVNGTMQSERTQVTVFVFPSPELSCKFPAAGKAGEDVTFLAVEDSGTAPFLYTFDFHDGTTVNTSAPSTVHKFKFAGDYDVNLLVTDANGCPGSCMTTIRIEDKIFIPNVITVNSDNVNATFSVFSVVDGKFVKYTGHDQFLMNVYNRWGEEIFNTDDPISGWNGKDAADGIYFYHILLAKESFKGWVQVIK